MSSTDLPKGWVQRESKSRNQPYWFNTVTGESTWERPSNDQVRILHLLKKHKDSRRPSSWRKEVISCTKEAATTELEGLRDRIVEAGGSDPQALRKAFEDLAKVESDCSSAKQGGDLGFFGRGQMQKPFEDTSYALQVGELSQIISTDSGVHILLRVA